MRSSIKEHQVIQRVPTENAMSRNDPLLADSGALILVIKGIAR